MLTVLLFSLLFIYAAVCYILTIKGRKILTVLTSDGENNILSRIGGMSEELYVPRVAPRASPRGKPSGMPLGQHLGHTKLVTISCKGILLENINCYFKNIFLPENEDKMSLY